MSLPNFKRDLKEGQDFEQEILEFVQIKYPRAKRILGRFSGYDIEVPEKAHKIECKNDKKSETTANIAIEFECSGKPSGITSTSATHWIHKFFDGEWKLAIGRVELFRELCEGKRVVNGGDGWMARMYLVPKVELLKKEGIKIRKPLTESC